MKNLQSDVISQHKITGVRNTYAQSKSILCRWKEIHLLQSNYRSITCRYKPNNDDMYLQSCRVLDWKRGWDDDSELRWLRLPELRSSETGRADSQLDGGRRTEAVTVEATWRRSHRYGGEKPWKRWVTSGTSSRASGVVARVMWWGEEVQVMRGSPEEMKEAVLLLLLFYNEEQEDPGFCPRCQGRIPCFQRCCEERSFLYTPQDSWLPVGQWCSKEVNPLRADQTSTLWALLGRRTWSSF